MPEADGPELDGTMKDGGIPKPWYCVTTGGGVVVTATKAVLVALVASGWGAATGGTAAGSWGSAPRPVAALAASAAAMSTGTNSGPDSPSAPGFAWGTAAKGGTTSRSGEGADVWAGLDGTTSL